MPGDWPNANPNGHIYSYGDCNGYGYSHTDSYAHGYGNANCHAHSYAHADTDANGSRNSDTYPDLRAGSIPGAHSVFRYRWTADHAAKPDTGRTGCDCGGPVRRL